MTDNYRTIKKRDVRKAKWFQEVSEFFSIDPKLLKRSAPKRRTSNLSEAQKKARGVIEQTFMSQKSKEYYEKVKTERPQNISDVERSLSWKEYIFLCINAERRAFQKMFLYDKLINCIVRPMLRTKGSLTVLDYGCGSSLFTRLLSQDFNGSVRTISADVCKYAVDFSLARNSIYNPNASAYLIEDVMASPAFKEIDIILAYAVFEHLPDSTKQIRGLIDSLDINGVLIENYSGHSQQIPHKSDTFNAYKNRDINLDMLRSHLNLLYGEMPCKRDGVYDVDKGDRFWLKGEVDTSMTQEMKQKLKHNDSIFAKVKRRVISFVNSR